jgi:nitrous oxidase accessory protein
VVDGGVYREGNIAIHKKVILVGVNNPVIDGEKKYEPISIHVPGVTVKGFTVRGSGKSNLMDVAAIKIYNVNDVIIKDNIIDDSFFGIYAQEAKHCTIENNQLKAYGENEVLVGNGIHAWKSDHLRISGNTVHGHRDGVYLEFVTNTEVRDNIVEDNLRYGLHFMFSHDNGYYHNTFSRNGAGVAVMYTRNVRMEYNVFNENWGDASYGLLLKDIMDSHIENNVFAKNTTGILMEGSNRVHIQRNRFEANGWALRIQSSCMDNVLLENNFIQNTFDLATNGALVSNRFERNYWDKYEGYDLDKDRVGDVPHRPVSLYSMIVEKHPMSMLLFRSFMVSLLDRTERMLPSLTPESLKDDYPLMKPVDL